MVEDIRLENPLVLAVQASIANVSEPHVDWTIGYAPEVDPDENRRFVLARLHAGDEDGSVTIEIGAGQNTGPMERIDADADTAFGVQLAASPSLSMLYGLARITAQSLLGTIDSDLKLPWEAPTPEVTRLVRPAENDEEGASLDD
ncbi:hypothetical protein WDU99_02870 [Microbacterium sp. Mu-80]|uniref:Preprotein translocase subunit SecB n=1 Tax=Microbacterium bandirmense TaxID=3122050 RepID=A0ABU8L8D4_9MICO